MSIINVIIPAYNEADSIVNVIKDIPQIVNEVIVVNNNSTDKSVNTAAGFCEEDHRFVLLDEQKQGVVHAHNRGIKSARGKYIARMDADDISLPRRFEKQINYLDSHTETGILGTWANVIDIHGNQTNALCFPVSSVLIEWSLIFKNCIVDRKSVV